MELSRDELLKRANSGDTGSYYLLAQEYYNHRHGLPDMIQAQIWAKKAIEAQVSSADAQALLTKLEDVVTDYALHCMKSGDDKFGFEAFLEEARIGHPLSMKNLSVCYYTGRGTAVDYQQSFYWMKQSAEHGCVYSYAALATKYLDGAGVDADLRQAEFWANKAIAAGQDVDAAQGVLAEISEARRSDANNSDPKQLCKQGVEQYQAGNYTAAFELFQRAAELGHALSMRNLCILYEQGQGVPLNREKAFHWALAAAEHGEASLYAVLGAKYMDGDGTAQDLDQAEFWANKALQANEDVEQANSVLATVKQRRTTDSPELADQLCRQALELYRQSDFTNALSLFQRSAEAGCAAAMNNLSVMYGNGYGVAKDLTEAFRWMKAAAEHGFAPSYSALAIAYYNGEGIAKNLDQAEFWANKALQANDGVEKANAVLAAVKQGRAVTTTKQLYNQAIQLHEQGKYGEAFPLFLRAAQAGHPRSMNMLSAMYANGRGTAKDSAESFRWLKAAAEHDCVSAYTALAMKYVKAIDTDLNLDLAEFWANKAIQSNEDVKRANSVLDMVKCCRSVANLSPEQACHQSFQLAQQKKYSEAFPVCLRSALSGCVTAMNNLSIMYGFGQGTDKDYVESYRWRKAAAEHGCAYAYASLACNYCYGLGTEPDFEQAEFWASKGLMANESVNLANSVLYAVKRKRANPDSYAEWLCNEAYRLSEAKGEEKDIDRAFPMLLYAAQTGHPRAMNNLSVMYANGEGTDKDPVEAFRWMKAAAEHDYIYAFAPLAGKYLHNNGTEMDLDQAEFWANKAIQANQGVEFANSVLASVKQKRTDPDALAKQLCDRAYQLYQQKDYDRAFPLFLRAAQTGYPRAMNNLSVMYLHGQGTEKDPVEAFRWMKAAAEHNYTPAYDSMASKYYFGNGTEPSLEQAEFWAKKAIQANKGTKNTNIILESVNAPDALARQLYAQANDFSQKKDYDRAFPLCMRAAQAGYPPAMNMLSVMYLYGQGTEKDPVESFRWIKAAAEKDYAFSYSFFAARYLDGTGTEMDLEKAEFWANKAIQANSNVENAKKVLACVKKKRVGTASNSSPMADSFSPEIVEAYNRGVTLIADQKHKAALPLLVQSAKAGYPPALRQLGLAIYEGQGVESHASNGERFFEAAAYRGDAAAARMLYQKTSYRPEAFMWRFCAEALGLPGSKNAHSALIAAERNRPGAALATWDARDAMTRAADRWSFYLRTRRQDGRYIISKNSDGTITHGNGSIDEALRYFSEAAKFGDPDGLCGMALVYQTFGMKKEMMRCYFEAAYLGHSFAMYRVAQYCEASDRKAAMACYQQAAKWGYPPAINWCNQRSVSY